MQLAILALAVALGPTSAQVPDWGPTKVSGNAAAPAPSWVPSTLAAWMLDEPTGNRVNAKGVAAYDLSVLVGVEWTSSTTDKMEGTASASLTPQTERQTTGTFGSLGTPISMGCWSKITSGAISNMMDRNAKPQLGRGGGSVLSQFNNQDGFTTPVADNTWAHTVNVYQLGDVGRLYINGVQVATGTGPTTMPADNTMLRIGDSWTLQGLVDECWIANLALSPAAICRICSCGLRGEQCTCNGAAFVSKGRNVTACGSCTLPACNAATPP